MSYRATPPRLKGYKPLYKGRRYWVFKNDPANPFQIDPTSPYGKWTTNSDILVYHREFRGDDSLDIFAARQRKAARAWRGFVRLTNN